MGSTYIPTGMRICDPAWIYICVSVYVSTQRSCMCQSIYTHFVYRVFCTQMSHYDWNEHHRTVTHRPKHIREHTHMSNMTQSLFTIHQYRDIGHMAHRNLLPTRTINVVGSVFSRTQMRTATVGGFASSWPPFFCGYQLACVSIEWLHAFKFVWKNWILN